MKAITVGLVDIGENLPFKLKTLIGKLNGLQRSFVFEHAGVVTSEALGTPDLKGKWYEIPRLWELAHAAAAKHCDLVIGVTKCRITHSGEKPDPADLDYFSRSDLKKVAVMSVNKSVLKFNAPGKSMLQFAAFIMVEEVMIMMSRVSLNHTKNAHCAFNECEEKDLFPGCMEHGQICHSCLIEIKKAGIADEFVASARAILRWCGKNTWTHAMNHTSKHPVPALFLGIGLGWFSSVYIEKQHYLAMLIVTVVPVVLTLLISKTTRAEAQ